MQRAIATQKPTVTENDLILYQKFIQKFDKDS
jgi:hypothetical protein